MRKTAIALSAFALAMTLGACGGNGSTSGDPKGTDGDAGGSVAAASVADLAKSIGDKTADKNSTHMKMTANAAGQDITGEGDLEFGNSDAAMTMDMTTPAGAMSMVLVDGVLYIKLPAGQELTPGKAWIKIDSSSNSELAKALGSITDQMSKNADPRATLAEFEKSGEITDTKEEQLNGEDVTHYTITVDVQKMADNQSDATLKTALDEAIKGGLKDFPVDVYINDDDLPVRIALEMPTPDGTGKTTTVKTQVDYTNWGEPVEIEAPPADQIAEMPA
jgi:hypothetical protein